MRTEIKGFFDEYRFLSNFWPAWVFFDGQLYPTTEHAYQAAKTFDEEIRFTIRTAKTAAVAKNIGGALKLRPDWEAVKEDVMLDLLIQKFTHPPLKKLLLATGTAYLEETNTRKDTPWGVRNGIGKNRLGHLLMSIREDIREIENA